MGDVEKGIEGSIPSDECCVACKGVLEKAQANGFGSGLCEAFQFLDA